MLVCALAQAQAGGLPSGGAAGASSMALACTSPEIPPYLKLHSTADMLYSTIGSLNVRRSVQARRDQPDRHAHPDFLDVVCHLHCLKTSRQAAIPDCLVKLHEQGDKTAGISAAGVTKSRYDMKCSLAADLGIGRWVWAR